MPVQYIDPLTTDPVVIRDDAIINYRTGEVVADIRSGIPRFIDIIDDETNSFSWQWNTWPHTSSDLDGVRSGLHGELLARTHFDRFNLEGKTVLECGMGGGDDTEFLITFPFSEIHCFDISNSVEKAAASINDERVVISQASIYNIPYPDESFDVVYCHRVLQHTPDPVTALRRICSKVKPGGILFAHSYKRSWRYMAGWKYKYRWLARRLPLTWIYWYVQTFGVYFYKINSILYKYSWTKYPAYFLIPFYHVDNSSMSESGKIEFNKLATFDALTPVYDNPMTSREFFGTIENSGFEILYRHDPRFSPLYCTARKYG